MRLVVQQSCNVRGAPPAHACHPMWAVLERASAGWRGFTITTDGLWLLQDLRQQLLELQPHTTTRRRPPVLSAQSPNIQSQRKEPTPQAFAPAVRRDRGC